MRLDHLLSTEIFRLVSASRCVPLWAGVFPAGGLLVWKMDCWLFALPVVGGVGWCGACSWVPGSPPGRGLFSLVWRVLFRIRPAGRSAGFVSVGRLVGVVVV